MSPNLDLLKIQFPGQHFEFEAHAIGRDTADINIQYMFIKLNVYFTSAIK